MLRELFILAVAILGIAIRPSFEETAIEAMVRAYNDTVEGAVSLKFHLRRSTNCPSGMTGINRELTISSTDRKCKVCMCGVATSATDAANCDVVQCDSLEAISSWNNTLIPSNWTSVEKAELFQLYRVDDGFCYIAEIRDDIGRTIRCYTERILP